MARKPPPKQEKQLHWYGLSKLGYADAIPVTGNYTRDQLNIEFICFRIGHTRAEGGLDKFGHYQKIVDLLWNNPEVGSQKRHIWSSWGVRMISKACEWAELGVAGCASAGKSDPFALWGVVNYIADPTHTLVLVLSTTLQGAKKRIFKSLREYWSSIPELPGKPLWSTNEIKGLNYEGSGYGDSSGIFLFASEQSSEKTATEKMQGIKAPRTGEPDESFENLRSHPEFEDLAQYFDEDQLRELLPRLLNLCHDRIGKLILIIDEATGCSEAILNVCRINLGPGNVGHFQVIMLGNPKSYYDTFGLFCQPVDGWASVTLADEEWETAGGGLTIRFNAEKNPRIIEKNEKFSWMPRAEDIKRLADTYGVNSFYYYQMVLGFWCPEGADAGVYLQSDIEQGGATTKAIWGFEPQVKLSSLDPAWALGGDRASCTFGLLGRDPNGKMILERTEEVPLKIDVSNKDVQPAYQIARAWRNACIERGVRPENASFDITGGGNGFGAIVRTIWSPQVKSVSFAGKASNRPVGHEKHPDGKPVLASERYGNRMSEIWCGGHRFFRSGQLRGVVPSLAKELCSRRYSKGSDNRVLTVENKREYKSRMGKSPDESDSFLIMVEDAMMNHGFSAIDTAGTEVPAEKAGSGSWNALKERARRLTRRNQLKH